MSQVSQSRSGGDHYRLIRKANPALAKLKELREKAKALPQCVGADDGSVLAIKRLEHTKFASELAAEIAKLATSSIMSPDAAKSVGDIRMVIERKSYQFPF